MGSTPASVELRELSERCPAFMSGGCPYSVLIHPKAAAPAADTSNAASSSSSSSSSSSTHRTPLIDVSEQEMLHTHDLLRKCPAFNSGCPFSALSNVESVRQLLATVPLSHLSSSDGGGGANSDAISDPAAYERRDAVLALFKRMHQVSVALERDMGMCPVFHTVEGCPFKTLTSSGRPLIDELEWRTWGLPQEPLRGDVELAGSLKSGTKQVHHEAENVAWMRHFIKGNVPLEQYVDLVAALYTVYSVMERLAEACKDDAYYGKLHFPTQLTRTDALEMDLRFFCGDGDKWRARVDAVATRPAVRLYAAALEELRASPALLVAHCYTRYLGDLSGGQILARLLRRHYKLNEHDGTRFYHFEHIENLKDFKNDYRRRLDELRVPRDLADRIVAEATRAFRLNIALFVELGELGGFSERPRPGAPSTRAAEASATSDGSKAVCPFASMAAKVSAEVAASTSADHNIPTTTTTTTATTPTSTTTAAAAAAGTCPVAHTGKAAATPAAVTPAASTGSVACPFHKASASGETATKKRAFVHTIPFYLSILALLIAIVAAAGFQLVR